MKKRFLLVVLFAVLAVVSFYFVRQQFFSGTPNSESQTAAVSNQPATQSAPNRTPEGLNASSSSTPADQTEPAETSFESDRQISDRFANATVIKTRETAPDKNGRYERKRLIRTDFKYPLILLQETLLVDSNTGLEHLTQQTAMVADHVMVKVPAEMSEEQINQTVAPYGGQIRKKMYAPGLYLVAFQNVDLDSVEKAVQQFSTDTGFLYAEPDYIASVDSTTPNDPDFNLLWGLHNSGQSIGGQTGTADADIDAPEAWDLSTGSADILVAVIDTGIDYNHADLSSNMWRNPGEIAGNGVDDDGNGFTDDVYGWDFCNDDSNPYDDHFHGTHCAGTIGGTGNNSAGVAGVSWTVRIMAVKFLSSSGSGTISDAVDATHYATRMKAKLSSNSWGGGGYSQSLFDAIEEASRSNILFVAAAGNASVNTDTSPNYPSCYVSENLIAVAATDNRDQLAYFSNYGLTSVDLGAPGVSVWSCKPGNQYQYLNGTSMATPHVAGACALVWSIKPDADATAIKQAILDGADPISALNSKCVTGGRLNVYNALLELEQNIALTPAKELNFSGYYGGSFSPESEAYTISNIGTNTFSWTADTTTNWLDLSATTGTLSPGQSNTIVVSINPGNASLLTVGTYTNTLRFSNTLNTNLQTRTVSLTVHGEISFDSPAYSVLEGGGTALLSVHRNGNTNRVVTVDFATSNGTATAGLDYIATNGTLTFAAGDTEKTFGIQIIDDTLSIEPSESVILTLSDPTGGSTLENPSATILSILDNTVTNGMVLKYTFDPDTSPVATDESPFGNNGQLTNADLIAGPFGNCLSLNGSNACIRTPSSESLMPTSITMTAWVKLDKAPGTWEMLIFKRNTQLNWNEGFLLQIVPDGRAAAVLSSGGSQKILYSSSPVTGEWHHVAATFEKPNFKIYVNGQLVGSTTHYLSIDQNTESDVLIGCRDHTYDPLSFFFGGLLDDIRIYNRALTAEEIASLLPQNYSLTVENGTGDGSYTNGTQVEIAADAPAPGKTFFQWTGAIQHVDNTTSSVTTVTMPSSNITVAATYTNLAGWYTLTVQNGTGSGLYSNGTAVVITANAPSAESVFDRWTGDTQYVSSTTSSTATVTMPDTNVTLTATYNTLTNGLVLNYTFDPDTSPIATDGSPYGNNGLLTNAAVITGQSGNCLSFNGTNAYIGTPSSTSLMPTSITMTAWVKITNAPGNWTTILFKRGGTEGYLLQLSPDGRPSVVLTSGTQTILQSPASITGGWHHVAATFDRPNLKIYVDGQLNGSTTHNYSLQHNTNANLFIGCREYQAAPLSEFFRGFMDDISIYNRALSPNEIAQLAIPAYLLTVENGSGYGTYTNGQAVAVSAYPPAEGLVFAGWTTVPTVYTNRMADRLSASTTFTMPDTNVLLTATYSKIYYTLTVTGGSGSGSYTNQQQVTITADAPPASKAFDRWTGDIQHVNSVTSSTATVTMPGTNISLTATYKDVYYALTVNNGNGGGSYTNGTVVAISANDAENGYVFSAWTTVPASRTNLLANRFSSSTTFTMPSAKVSVTAKYRLVYNYTVDSDSITITGYTGSGGNIVIPDTLDGLPVTRIGDLAFANCISLTSVTIPDSVASIGYKAFDHSGLTNITVPASVVHFSNDSYGYGCAFAYTPLRTATVRGALIGNNMFQGCYSLTNVVLNGNPTTIPVSAFYNCHALPALWIPETVTSIESAAFLYSGLNNIYIPESVTNIGGSAFNNCTNLTGVYFSGNAPGFAPPIFTIAGNPTIYRTSQASGWPTVPLTWADRPTALWQKNSDTDDDALPDFWEIAHFGSLTEAHPGTICVNGVNTLRQAYIAGVNPNDPLSLFQTSGVYSRTTGNLLQWPSVSGRVYSVYFSTNLLNGFEPLATNIHWSAGCFTDRVHNASSDGYYRIEVQLEP